MAHFWAGNCEYELNENRNTQSTTFSYVGQSLAAGNGYSFNYTIMVRRWLDVGKINYNYYSRTCVDEDGNEDEDGEACWPYTQVSACMIICNVYYSGVLPSEKETTSLQRTLFWAPFP